MSARLLAFLLVAVWSVGPVGAQSGPAVETFDLVLVGDHLRAEAHRVALKTNPTTGASWTVLEETRCPRTNQLLVLSDLSATRYLGQDIRENHLTLRITTPSSTEDARGALRAVYVVPSTEPIDTAACAQLARLARTTPQALRRHSLAIYERPRPASLRAGTPFLDHVEASVRHRKPGVVEVEWLNVLFGKEE